MAPTTGRPDPWATLAKLVAALIAAGVLAAGMLLPYVGGLGLVAGHEADKFRGTACTLQESKPPQKTTLYARDGKTIIATLFSQDRVPIPLSQVPNYLQDALVATEDRRFYSHHGVDMRGLLRSAVSTSSGATQGGSTLTMQYVKQIRYYQAGDDPKKQAAAIAQNLNRKIEDAKCALYIEGTLHESKGTILDNYLNIAFFGEHSYGIQTAAETYFNKPANKLTLGESAMLVGMLRAPSAYDPFLNRAAATARRNEVLQNLVSVNKLSQAAADREKQKPIALATSSPPIVHQGCPSANRQVLNAAFFCEYTTHWLESNDKLSQTQLETGGLKIVTTLDPRLQNSAQQQLSAKVPATSPMTAVLPIVQPRTGDVLAMATSKHYGARGRSETEQPVFTSHTAQAQSTFKLFPLLAALSTGVPSDWQLETAANTGSYRPRYCLTSNPVRNGDAHEFYDRNESLRSATAKSSNTFFVGLADQLLGCHLAPIVTIAQRLGMQGLSMHEGNSKQTVAQEIVAQQQAQRLVLGSVPTSPLELAGAYAAVANGGTFNEPAPVLSITDSSGNQLPVRRVTGQRVLPPQVAAEAVDILTGDTQGVGTSANRFDSWYAQNSSQIAGKTGTAESNRKNKNAAIWFVGMTPSYVATSALINFDSPSAPSTGLPGEAPGEAYGDYAAQVWLAALQPSVAARHWTWPDPATVPGIDVPDLTDATLAEASRLLKLSGFKMTVLGGSDNILCPSGSTAYGHIAYYGPHRATPGATITVCKSSGVGQTVYTPPPPPVIIQHTSTPPSSSSKPSTSAKPSSPAPPTKPTKPKPTGRPHKTKPPPGG